MAFLSTISGDMMSTYPGVDLSSTYDLMSTYPGVDLSSTYDLIPDCDTYYNMVCNDVLNDYRSPYEAICISLGLSVTPQDVQFSNCGSSFDTKMWVYQDISLGPISSNSDCDDDGDDCGQCSSSNNENFIIPALSGQYTIVLDAFSRDNSGSFQVAVNCGDEIEYSMFSSTMFTMFSSTNDYTNNLANNNFTCNQTYTKEIYDNSEFSVTGYRNPYETICIKIYNFPNSDVQFSNCKSQFDTTMVIFQDWSDPFAVSIPECDGDDCGYCPNGNSNKENFILDSLVLYGTEYTIVLDAYEGDDSKSGGFEVEINTGSYVQYDMFMFSSTMMDTTETSETDTETSETDTTTTLYESTTTNTQPTTTTDVYVTDFLCANVPNHDLFNAACQICLHNKEAQEICEDITDDLDEEYKQCFKEACPKLKCDFQNIAVAEDKQGRCDCSWFQCIGSGNDTYGYILKMNVMSILLVGVYFVFHSI